MTTEAHPICKPISDPVYLVMYIKTNLMMMITIMMMTMMMLKVITMVIMLMVMRLLDKICFTCEKKKSATEVHMAAPYHSPPWHIQFGWRE